MIEDEKKEEGKENEAKENKRPDLSKLERSTGWEGNIDGGSCQSIPAAGWNSMQAIEAALVTGSETCALY